MFTKKDLWKLIAPLIVEQFLAVAIGMADTIMVTSCGEEALSAVSNVDAINILLINIFSALATGGAIVASQFIGREDDGSACVAAKQLLMVTTIISVVIMGGCLLGGDGLLGLIYGGAEPLIMENSRVYFFWSALSYPFIAIYNAGAALFRAMGNSRVSMMTAILMNVLNISGNALLIFGFQMGVAGAAISSLVSRMAGAVLIILLLRFRPHRIHFDRIFRLDFQPKMVRNILAIGVPSGLENGMFQVGKILVQSLVVSLGTASIAANAVGNSVAALPQIPGAAIGLAMITVVGQCVGAGRLEEAKAYTFKLTGLAYAAMIPLCIVEICTAAPVVSLFDLSGEGAALAVQLLTYHGVTCSLLWPASFVMPNGLRAANDVRFTMTVSMLSMWIFRIGFSYLLVNWLELGILGVWIAMTVDWLVRVVVFLFRLFSGRWKRHAMASGA